MRRILAIVNFHPHTFVDDSSGKGILDFSGVALVRKLNEAKPNLAAASCAPGIVFRVPFNRSVFPIRRDAENIFFFHGV